MLLYFVLVRVIFYCNFVTCNSLLPNTEVKFSSFAFRHVNLKTNSCSNMLNINWMGKIIIQDY